MFAQIIKSNYYFQNNVLSTPTDSVVLKNRMQRYVNRTKC